MMNVASRIERLLRKGEVTASQIGRAVMNDPGLVRNLRNGRQLRPESEARLAAWLEAAEQSGGDEA
jgi:2,4-dienoyl-CoA reductase-like NADH-dependent reductase (Old Yellow Enzyme family)